MSERYNLGDMCQNLDHDVMTAPIVLPYRVVWEGDDSVRAEYRCECGAEWPCWWVASVYGWTEEDAEAAA